MIGEYERSLPAFGWPNWVLGSHDAPRIAARLGEAQARVAAMLLLTLRGTPTLYQGDELGIGEVAIPPERMRDPQHFREPALGIGRDRSRTPMPWDASPNAGFSTVEPWLPLNADWPMRNVAAQEADPNSLLHLHRKLLRLRREYYALSIGTFELLDSADETLIYRRKHESEELVVALNLGSQTRACRLPDRERVKRVLASTLGEPALSGKLRPDEGLILQLRAES